ncbi:hypothetical protein [Luteolibacter luteus]|uniref:Methanolan biosynthesis EpsI domain-containing protein n=1 Tax=Luteolibacter luteus TaxID=2728835 RepID=A0A858RBC8_9BACT|nr:hypothetical protein [Luteolibacter luteus]QJE94296.1 hypothetical protein HHL09_00345 [Luteolibacter luteus]
MKVILPVVLMTALILSIEAGVQHWRHASSQTSHAPLFNWKDAKLVTEAPPPFGRALQLYRPDRGMERFDDLENGRRLQLIYMEWDKLEVGPLAAVAGHESDICNSIAGFQILEKGVPRTFTAANGQQLVFHYTRLKDPKGNLVHNYKIPWIQGLGAWHVGSSSDRGVRLSRSFIRHSGAARVIQMGVFGENDEAKAWDLVQNTLNKEVEWR